MKKVVKNAQEWERAFVREVLKREGLATKEDAKKYAELSWEVESPKEFPCILICFIVPCGSGIDICTEHVYINDLKKL